MNRVTLTLLIFVFAGSARSELPIDEQLKNAILPMVRAHRGEVGLAIRNLESGVHYEFHADVPMPTASLIKLPVMIAAYRMVDEGQLDLSTSIALQAEDKVPGSGVLTEHFSDGVRLPVRDYMRLMIRYSDNTATNIVADQIGLRRTAETMEALGFPNTKLHSKVYRGSTTVFPERSRQFGIGSTTAREMITLLQQFEAGKLASKESTSEMRDHLLRCDDDSKIAALLPTEVRFAHKTGAIANCRTDAGILYTEAGPIAVCFLSNKNKDQSWSDENEANQLAANIGAAIIDRFGSPDQDKRLREGSFGRIVESVQRTLNARLTPSPNLAIDGDFGPATRRAVERFQRTKKIEPSGVVTDETWRSLGTLIEHDEPVPPPGVVNTEERPVSQELVPGDPPIVTAKAWVIADQNGNVVFEFHSNAPLEAASTTKIMTAYLVVRLAAKQPEVLEETVEFSARADDTVGSTSGIRAGEKVSVRDLLYGLMLPSGNDASVALAEHFGARVASKPQVTDSDEAYRLFVEEMNAAADSLGLKQAHYETTHGLSHEEHLISASDLIRLTREAMKYELFRKLAKTRQFGCAVTGPGGYQRNLEWTNTNRLLRIEGYSGVKTGTTSAAGACLVATGARAGDELTVVVLGSSSSPARYADIRNLFRWAWQVRSETTSESN